VPDKNATEYFSHHWGAYFGSMTKDGSWGDEVQSPHKLCCKADCN